MALKCSIEFTVVFSKDQHFYSHKKCNSLLEISEKVHIKGAVSGLRKFLRTESPLKMMKNAFYFTLKSSFRSQDT